MNKSYKWNESGIKTRGPYSLKEIHGMIAFKFMEKSSEDCDKIKYWSYAAKYNFAKYLLDRKGVKYDRSRTKEISRGSC